QTAEAGTTKTKTKTAEKSEKKTKDKTKKPGKAVVATSSKKQVEVQPTYQAKSAKSSEASHKHAKNDEQQKSAQLGKSKEEKWRQQTLAGEEKSSSNSSSSSSSSSNSSNSNSRKKTPNVAPSPVTAAANASQLAEDPSRPPRRRLQRVSDKAPCRAKTKKPGAAANGKSLHFDTSSTRQQQQQQNRRNKRQPRRLAQHPSSTGAPGVAKSNATLSSSTTTLNREVLRPHRNRYSSGSSQDDVAGSPRRNRRKREGEAASQSVEDERRRPLRISYVFESDDRRWAETATQPVSARDRRSATPTVFNDLRPYRDTRSTVRALTASQSNRASHRSSAAEASGRPLAGPETSVGGQSTPNPSANFDAAAGAAAEPRVVGRLIEQPSSQVPRELWSAAIGDFTELPGLKRKDLFLLRGFTDSAKRDFYNLQLDRLEEIQSEPTGKTCRRLTSLIFRHTPAQARQKDEQADRRGSCASASMTNRGVSANAINFASE
uniref:HECT-type E3 ubiquitin transferase TRIP12 n=1 Tax=Macrostomum lignano TaxID=282301 RepID=A0A1I8FJY9_9PLAT